MFEFSRGSIVIPTPYAYHNLLNKKFRPVLNASTTLFWLRFWFFVDACENLVMVDDVATPSNPPVSLVKKKELEEAPLDVNVSQRLREKEPSKKMVRTQVFPFH
jgi:hypothetical protein